MASPLLRETCSASFSGARPCCLYSSQRGERPEAMFFLTSILTFGYFLANFERLVLGCIAAEFGK